MNNACENDSDCILINSGNCCGKDIPVNKKFFTELNKAPPEHCKYEKHYCPPVEVKCVNNICQKITLQK